jgi:hypothetical protein
MTLSVTTPVPSARTTGEPRVVSPELALIDPALAAEERASLPDPFAVAPLRRTADVPRDDESRVLPAVAWAPREAHDLSPNERERTRPAWTRLVVVAAGSALVLLLLDVRVDVGRTPASAGRSGITVPEASPEHGAADSPAAHTDTHAVGPKPTVRTPEPAASRRFAWAPVADAESYRVELFRGETRVFVGTTARAELTVPAHWRLEGKQQALTAGDYRWYVWPIVAGRRAASAVVQATLTVP